MDTVLLSLSFLGFAWAGFYLGRLSKAAAIAQVEERLTNSQTAYEALRAKYEALTDRDEKGRFVRRVH